MHSFFAYLSRMRHIQRWSLMRNTRNESILEHSSQCAQIAHALAVLHNARHGGGANPSRAAELAIFHDAPEVITGDLPTPVKYFSEKSRRVYNDIEKFAVTRLLSMLPDDIAKEYEGLINSPESDPEWPRVKAADRICAYIKCVEEGRMGNQDFDFAKQAILRDIENCPLPEVADFMRDFMPAFSLTLDELNK